MAEQKKNENSDRLMAPRQLVISLSTIVMIAIAFGGWHVSSLRSLEEKMDKTQASHEVRINQRIADGQLRYGEDIERIFRAIADNRNLFVSFGKDIVEIKVRVGRAEVKQDLILEKIKLTE